MAAKSTLRGRLLTALNYAMPFDQPGAAYPPGQPGPLDLEGPPPKPKPEDLKGEVAYASLTGVRQAWTSETVVAGLTPQRLASIMRRAAEGDHVEYVILAEEMEERDWHYAGALGQRKLAITRLERTIEAASDSALDKEIAEACREVVQDECFEDFLASSLDGLGKGWAATEIGWDTTGDRWKPCSYTWRDPRWFRWDRETGQELRLIDEQNVAFGIPLAPYRFSVHRPQLKMGLPVKGGLARLAAWAFLFKFYSVKDWAAYCETYGQPLRLGKYDPAALKEDIEILRQAVAMIGTDCSAVVPQAMQIEFVDAQKGASGSGAELYQAFCTWLDLQVSKAVLGQTGTTDMQHGGGLAQAKVLDGVRDDLRDSDAKQLARTIKRDVLEPFVRFNWGDKAAVPTFQLQAVTPEDLERLAAGLGPFIDRGLRVRASEIREKFELDEPGPDDEVLTPGGAGAASIPLGDRQALNRRPMLLGSLALNRATPGQADTDEVDRLAAPLNNDWEPMMDALLEPLIQLAARCDSFDQFQDELDQAGTEMDISPLAKALALQMFKAKGLGDATDSVA